MPNDTPARPVADDIEHLLNVLREHQVPIDHAAIYGTTYTKPIDVDEAAQIAADLASEGATVTLTPDDFDRHRGVGKLAAKLGEATWRADVKEAYLIPDQAPSLPPHPDLAHLDPKHAQKVSVA